MKDKLIALLFFWPTTLLIHAGVMLLALNRTSVGRVTVRPAFRLFCRFVLYGKLFNCQGF